jgi:hypothetical protein
MPILAFASNLMNYNTAFNICPARSHISVNLTRIYTTVLETIRVKNLAENGDKNIQITFWQLLLSTLSAFIGVQSNANRERDFKYGKISHFIFIGLLFGLVFIFTLVTVVKIVMSVSAS